MKSLRLNFSNLAVLLLPLFCCACLKGSADSGSAPAIRRPIVTWDGNGAEAFKPAISQQGSEYDLTMALATCECAPAAAGKLLTARATNAGVLPQVFVPQIRQGIATDPKLATLNNMGAVGGWLKNMFASDQKIAGTVRDSLQEKLQANLASVGGTNLSSRIQYQFGLFDASSANPQQLDANVQSIRWNLVAGRKEMWTNGKPLDGVDHGLQLLETARMAAEWAYIFGIGGDGKPNGYGGLAQDVLTGNAQFAKPSDPSAPPPGSGLFFSGHMTIAYPNASSVTLATQVRETWSMQPDNVSVLSLARIWNAAAMAFINFRPDVSPGSRPILTAQNGVLSSSLQKLPLVWLNGFSQLIESRVINKNARIIRQSAYSGNESEVADLDTLVMLAHALQNWRTATTNIAGSGLSPDLLAKLAPVPNQVTAAIQLSVQCILATKTFVTTSPLPRLYVGTNPMAAPPKQAAEVIAALAEFDQKTLNSAELRQIVLSLYASHIAEWVKTSGTINDAPTVIAMLRLSRLMAAYPQPPTWVGVINKNLEEAVKVWGGAS